MPDAPCPSCGKPGEKFEKPEKWLPFCSHHCKQADLGKWLTGYYQVSRPLDAGLDGDLIPQDEDESSD